MDPFSGELATRLTGEGVSYMTPARGRPLNKLMQAFACGYSRQRPLDRGVVFGHVSHGGAKVKGCTCAFCRVHHDGPTSDGQKEMSHSPRTISDIQLSKLDPIVNAGSILDEALLSPKIASRVKQTNPAASIVQNSTQPPRVIPQSNSVVWTAGNMVHKAAPQQASSIMASELQEMKLEEKRRRNRVSAAKSNQRKKLQVEAQERELKLLREKKCHLVVVQDKLKSENLQLKAQAKSMT